jgi:hypothetical protein
MNIDSSQRINLAQEVDDGESTKRGGKFNNSMIDHNREDSEMDL